MMAKKYVHILMWILVKSRLCTNIIFEVAVVYVFPTLDYGFCFSQC